MVTQEIDLAAVQAERREHFAVGQHVVVYMLTADPAQEMIAARVVDVGKFELANVAPDTVHTRAA